MAIIDPAEFGAKYPEHLDPAAVAQAPEGERVICDAGIFLFGVAAGEAVVHTMVQTPAAPRLAASPNMVG